MFAEAFVSSGAYHLRMPYVTWAEVAGKVGGEKRLVEVVLAGHDDTADDHPFFDETAAVVDRLVDTALAKAGYEIPLEELTDPLLRDAWIGLFVGKATEASSSRERWMELHEASAKEYLDQLKGGELSVVGAEEEADTSAQIVGSYEDESVFDSPTYDYVFGSLGPPPWRGRW